MPTLDLPKAYDPQAAQNRWYPFWLERGYFHADPASPKPPYSIVIPPPNVTGALHLGHALNNTLQDILIRWRRMQGFDTLWMPGTDHAGIATEAVVEKRIYAEEKKTRHDLGRTELVRRIRTWKDDYEARILNQLRALGCSCDWQRTRFTFDEGFQHAVRRTFFNLFKAGKIYRGTRLVNWDTQLRTAVADDEIYTEDVKGKLWHIRYPVAGSQGESLVVATTRPETMLGDTAVAVHPDDERYRHLIGMQALLPLLDRAIPIIADEVLVDKELGTGCVKVTPAHDPSDYACGLRHGLPQINLLNPDGTYNGNAGPYSGLKISQVRERVLADLEARALLVKVEDKIIPLKYSDRSKTPIEPYLSDQWFVRMGDNSDGSPGFAQQAMNAVTLGQVKIHPERYAKSYLDWLSEKRDWCISRQLWWGHRIPIWHCPEGVSEDDLQRHLTRDSIAWRKAESGGWLICSEHDLTGHELGPEPHLSQDPDVLDTWFSSALWPSGTLGWPDATPELAKYHPTSVLSTARDIITLWVARMVIFAEFNLHQVPFKDVFIHPVIQDGDGKRMSKSAGNGIDPLDIIDTFGADALRFTLASTATETQDLRMPVEPVKNAEGLLALRSAPGQPIEWVSQELWKKAPKDQRVNTSERFELGRTFPNKFWNAARLVLMNLEDYSDAPLERDSLPVEDRWILSTLDRTAREVSDDLQAFRFAEASKRLRDFTWNDFCDWYLEFVKGRLRDKETRAVAQRVLVELLDTLCRLLHPFIPFVTEEVWQALNQVAPDRQIDSGKPAPSVCIAGWPASTHAEDIQALSTVDHWRGVVTALRNLRSERGVPTNAKIHPTLVTSYRNAETLLLGAAHIRSLAGAESLRIVQSLEISLTNAAVAVLADVEIHLPLEGLIDRDAERARLLKAKADLEKPLSAVRAKLQNASFLERAPADVVEAQRTKEEELLAQLVQFETLLSEFE
jgi:valyl-tRNA synthetase